MIDRPIPLALLLLAVLLPSPGLAVLKGDVNLDGEVSLADVFPLQQHLAGGPQLTGEAFDAADVAPAVGGFIEPDGELGLGDLVVLLRSLEGSVELRPPPPTLDADPATTDNPLTVTGTASPNATIHLYVNGEEQYISGQADPDGTFSLPAILYDGSNTLCAVAETSFGVSDPSACTAVTYTNDVPRDLCNGQTWYDVGLVGAPEVVVWTPGGGPYEVEAPCSGIRVNEASTLILQPGAELAAVPPDGGGPIDPFQLNVYDGATLVIRQGVTIKVLESLWVTGINPADPKGGGLIDIQISESDPQAVTLEFEHWDYNETKGARIEGTLRARGTADGLVSFTIDSDNPSGKWSGLRVTPCDVGATECHALDLDHVTISSGYQAVWKLMGDGRLGEIHIANTTIRDCSIYCVEFDLDAEGGLVIEDSTIDCDDGSHGIVLSNQTTSPASIISNTIEDCNTGISVSDGSVEILANYITDNGYGIRLGSGGSTVTALVSGNYIHDNTSFGISLSGGPASSVIIDDSVASGGPLEIDGHNNFIVGSTAGVAIGQILSPPFSIVRYEGTLTIRGQTIGGKPFPDGDPGGDPVYASYPAIQVQAAYWPAPPAPPLILIENNDIHYAAKGIEVMGSVVEIVENEIHHNQGAGVDFVIPFQNLYPQGASILTRNDIHHNQEGVRVQYVEVEVRLDGFNLIHDHTGPGVHMFTDSYGSPSLVLNHTVFNNNNTNNGGNPDLVIEGGEPPTLPIVDARWNWWGGDGSIGEVENSFSIAQGSAAAIDFSYFITSYGPADPYFDQTPPTYDPFMHFSDIAVWVSISGGTPALQHGIRFSPTAGQTAEISFYCPTAASGTIEFYNEGVYQKNKEDLSGLPDPLRSISWVLPAAGAIEESWDGTDEAGLLLPDEAYIFLIRGTIDSVDYVWQPTGTAGQPSVFWRSDFGAPVPVQGGILDANIYRNEFWTHHFQMNSGPARFSVRLLNSDGSLNRTIVDSGLFREGIHTIYFDGRQADGTLVPPGTDYKVLASIDYPYVDPEPDYPQKVSDYYMIIEESSVNLAAAFASNDPADLSPPEVFIRPNPYLVSYSYDQVTNIEYCVDKQAEVTVQILKPDSSGTVIATLQDHVSVAPSAACRPICGNGVDDDGDGLTDFPTDPDCLSRTDSTEGPAPTAGQCDDDSDNDGDGQTDYPADPECTSAEDTTEGPDPTWGGSSATLPLVADGASALALADEGAYVFRVEASLPGQPQLSSVSTAVIQLRR